MNNAVHLLGVGFLTSSAISICCLLGVVFLMMNEKMSFERLSQ
jgi:hypothetical protein